MRASTTKAALYGESRSAHAQIARPLLSSLTQVTHRRSRRRDSARAARLVQCKPIANDWRGRWSPSCPRSVRRLLEQITRLHQAGRSDAQQRSNTGSLEPPFSVAIFFLVPFGLVEPRCSCWGSGTPSRPRRSELSGKTSRPLGQGQGATRSYWEWRSRGFRRSGSQTWHRIHQRRGQAERARPFALDEFATSPHRPGRSAGQPGAKAWQRRTPESSQGHEEGAQSSSARPEEETAAVQDRAGRSAGQDPVRSGRGRDERRERQVHKA